MAFLKVIKGSVPGQILELHGERMMIGRHPSCHIVLDNVAVSRHHAQILESHGTYYLEDLRSRNRTYLNGDVLEGRSELHDGDRIKVCDVIFGFQLMMPEEADSIPLREIASDSTLAVEGSSVFTKQNLAATVPEADIVELLDTDNESPGDDAEEEHQSSIVSTLDVRAGSDLRLDVKPEAKLRAMLKISTALGSVLKLEDVLDQTLEGLFQLFPAADNGFVLLKDVDRGKFVVKATRSRTPGEEDRIRISKTIIKQAVQGGEAILSHNAAGDERFQMSDSVSLWQIRSMMCVPLLGHDETVWGVLQLDTKDLTQKFSQDDLDMLAAVALQVGHAVEYAYMHEQLLARENVQRDLEIAREVQLSFLPNLRPRLENFEFFDYYEPAIHVGGDYFDYVTFPDGRVAIALGDVAGKGISAALLMARLYSAARFYLLTQPTPAAALAGLNKEIASSGLGHRFITCVFMVLDPKTAEVTIVNAGHLPPLLRRNGGTEIIEVGKRDSGMPLVVAADQTFKPVTVVLQPNDSLTVYTDGITETMDPSSKDPYRTSRLIEFLKTAPVSSEELVQAIVEDVDRYSQQQPQGDDRCLVSFRRLA